MLKSYSVDQPLGIVTMANATRIAPGASPICSGFEFDKKSWKRRNGLTKAFAFSGTSSLLLLNYEKPKEYSDFLQSGNRLEQQFKYGMWTLELSKSPSCPVSTTDTVTFTWSEIPPNSNSRPYLWLMPDITPYEAVWRIDARESATSAWTTIIGPSRYHTSAPHTHVFTTTGTYHFRVYWSGLYVGQASSDAQFGVYFDASGTYTDELAYMAEKGKLIIPSVTVASVSGSALFSDDFDRTDGLLGSDWNTYSATVTINSNTAFASVSSVAYALASCKKLLSSADMLVSARSKSSDTYANDYLYLFARASGSGSPLITSNYFVVVNDASTRIYRRNDLSTVTKIASTTSIRRFSSSYEEYQIQVKTVGGDVEVKHWRNGSLILSVTDSSASKLTTGGYNGFGYYLQDGESANTDWYSATTTTI